MPNLLSSLRIALAPAVLGAAYSDSRVGFSALLAVALITDALDGFLARRWGAETELGRQLDGCGDALTFGLAAMGFVFLWPQVIEREAVWMMVALAGYVMIGVSRLVQTTIPGWKTKVLGALVPLSLVPLFAGWVAWPFHVAAFVQVAVGIEKLCRLRAAPKMTETDTPAKKRDGKWLVAPKRRAVAAKSPAEKR